MNLGKIYMKLGDAIRNIRLENQLSQDKFAKLIGTTQQTLSRWENNIHLPTLIDGLKMSRALQISLDELFGDVDLKEYL